MQQEDMKGAEEPQHKEHDRAAAKLDRSIPQLESGREESPSQLVRAKVLIGSSCADLSRTTLLSALLNHLIIMLCNVL